MNKLFTDLPAFVSVFCASVTMADIDTLVSILAGIVAIVAGGLAIWRHLRPKGRNT